jgi:hypothetical protein
MRSQTEELEMQLTDERLGEVLNRQEHIGGLPEINPVLWGSLQELAATQPKYRDEILAAGSFMLDLLGMNEPGSMRVGLPTAVRVLAEMEYEEDRLVHRVLFDVGTSDVLLRMCIDALVAYSDRSRRVRPRRERDAVAVALFVLVKMIRDQLEAGVLEEALAG